MGGGTSCPRCPQCLNRMRYALIVSSRIDQLANNNAKYPTLKERQASNGFFSRAVLLADGGRSFVVCVVGTCPALCRPRQTSSSHRRIQRRHVSSSHRPNSNTIFLSLRWAEDVHQLATASSLHLHPWLWRFYAPVHILVFHVGRCIDKGQNVSFCRRISE